MCYLYVNDERYRRLWDGQPAINGETNANVSAPATAVRSLPCIHLGAPTGDLVKCETCSSTRMKTFACSVYGACTLEKRGVGTSGLCKGCVSYAAFPPIKHRNLLYHVYPVKGNGVWQWNIKELLKRINLFNHKRIVAVVTDGSTDCLDDVKRAFGDTISEFIELPNSYKLREVVSFESLFSRVKSLNADEVTFWGHAKGVTSRNWAGQGPKLWAEAMLELCLDYWPAVAKLLATYPVVGSFKRNINGWPGKSVSTWHYSGSYVWLRNKELFSRAWKRIEQFNGGIESYPSLQFKTNEAGCLFYEFTKPGTDWLYQVENWGREITPAFTRWKEQHKGERTSTAHQTNQAVIDDFHRLYYDTGHQLKGTWTNTFWRGVPVEKCPLDLHIYHEVIHEVRPTFIIETGTKHGGSALFFADMLELEGIAGKVLTIDINEAKDRPGHPRIIYLSGSSIDPFITRDLPEVASSHKAVMVVLDSNHSKAHVLAELQAYAPLVTVGSYLVCEDTNVFGHPVNLEHGPGPAEAVDEFLQTDLGKCFERDRSREKLLLTFHPGGWLRRVR